MTNVAHSSFAHSALVAEKFNYLYYASPECPLFVHSRTACIQGGNDHSQTYKLQMLIDFLIGIRNMAAAGVG